METNYSHLGSMMGRSTDADVISCALHVLAVERYRYLSSVFAWFQRRHIALTGWQVNRFRRKIHLRQLNMFCSTTTWQ